jgi:predicted kinase
VSQGRDVSDGRWEIYLKQKVSYEAPDEIESADFLELDTDAPVEKLADTCEQFVRARLETTFLGD